MNRLIWSKHLLTPFQINYRPFDFSKFNNSSYSNYRLRLPATKCGLFPRRPKEVGERAGLARSLKEAHLVCTRLKNANQRARMLDPLKVRWANTSRVKFSDWTPLTAGVRFRLTGPVSPVTGRNRTNANLNSNSPVETVLTGIPAGLTGLPAGLTGKRSVWLVTGQIQIFFLFLFKFKCPQSILNKCLYNIF